MRLNHAASLALAIALAGCARSPSVVATSSVGAYEAALAVLSDAMVVAWYDTRDGNADIYFRELDSDGQPAGPERRLTSGPEDSYEASIDRAGDSLAVAWYDKDAAGVLTATVGVWERTGRGRWSVSLGPRSRNPVVRSDGTRVFSAWIAGVGQPEESVWAAWWDANGRPLTPPGRIGPAGKTTWNLNVALDDTGVAWVVYDAVADTTAEELFAARVDESGSMVTRLSADDGRASKYPDLAIDGGRTALTWFDERDGNTEVYLVVGTRDTLLQPLGNSARRVTNTPGESIGAYVTWNSGRVGLAWSDESAGQHEVFFQSFDARGAPLAEPQRITSTPTSSLIPAIRPWRDGFALAWNEYRAADRAHDEHGGSSHVVAAVVD